MNIRYLIKRLATKIAKLIPSSIHQKLLKQYLYDSDLTLRHGIICLKQDYSSPVTVAAEIDVTQLGSKRDLPGIKFDSDAIQKLGYELGRYSSEFPWRSSANDHPEVPWGFMFPTLDSLILYSMIRHFKPTTYIEVGCGHSSKVSSMACKKNRSENIDTQAKYIEPYPSKRLDEENLDGELIVKRIQEIPLSFFEALKPGDILFIDTSHIMKCQSDVEWELLHILPAIRKGVIIHIHDIYTPFEYPLEWLDNNYAPGLYNEQYAVEALLSGGDRFKPLFPAHALCREFSKELHNWFGVDADTSRSFWMITN